MKSGLHVLLVEDNPFDAKLIERELKAADLSFKLTLVQTEEELRRELEPQPPDLILSDHGLPSFDGFKALQIVREKFPNLPFIFVSGSNHQGMVVEMFDRGASDYVFKGDIADLAPAVRHALEAEAEAEPKSRLPDESTSSPASVPVDHLELCPECLKVHDESGQLAQMWDHFRSHEDVLVHRKLCAECERRRSSG